MKQYWPRVTAGMVLAALIAAIMAPKGWAQGLAIQSTQGLSFGSFVAGSGGFGAVTIAPNGDRSPNDDVWLLGANKGQAAQFKVTGEAHASYIIELPVNNFVKLSGPGSEMVINDFTSSPSGSGLLSAGGTQTLSVGGTLKVGSGQAAGAYSGTFSVTVYYN